MKISYSVISDIGKRNINQDAVKVINIPEESTWLGIVCDGLGGHSKGEIASTVVIDTIVETWLSSKLTDRKECILEACKAASIAIDKRSDELGRKEMGTTMVMAVVTGDTITVANLGDSRCYLMRPGEGLLFRTIDHTIVFHGKESINRCFFSYVPSVARPTIDELRLQSGDRILLCSDGIYRCFTSDELETLVMSKKHPAEIIEEFNNICKVEAKDNYTAIMAVVE